MSFSHSFFLWKRSNKNKKDMEWAKNRKKGFEAISGRLKTGTVGVRNSFGIGPGQGRLAGKAGTLERMFCPR
jgi:hypothetical protein